MLKKQCLKSEDIREVTFYAAPELKAEKGLSCGGF